MADHAPLYSRRERVRLVLLAAAVVAPLFALSYYWFIPWLEHYARFANCFRLHGINGLKVLMYGLFVGIPLATALLVLLLFGRRSLRILRAGQDPLPGEKMLRKTRYRYGKMALITPAGLVLMVLVFVGLALWGAAQAEKFSRKPVPCSDEQQRELNREAENRK